MVVVVGGKKRRCVEMDYCMDRRTRKRERGDFFRGAGNTKKRRYVPKFSLVLLRIKELHLFWQTLQALSKNLFLPSV